MNYIYKQFSVCMPCHVSDEDWAAAFSRPKVSCPDCGVVEVNDRGECPCGSCSISDD